MGWAEMAGAESRGKTASANSDPLQISAALWEEKFDTPGGNFLAMTAVMRSSQILNRTIGEVLEPYNLQRAGYLFLMTLYLSPSGAEKLGRISRYLLVHPTTVTIMADQFEVRNLVVRTPHPTDRRAILCALTPIGRRLVEKATKDLIDCNFGLGDITEEQGAQLLRMMQQIYSA